MPLGLAIGDNMRASLCCRTLENARKAYPDITGCIIHSDRGSQYTSAEYRDIIGRYGIIQSMNSDGGRCHDNARCESMWARMKDELFYSRGDKSENYTISELTTLIWRYFMSYWTNRRICTANTGLPPAVKRARYYDGLNLAAWNLFEINVSSIIDNSTMWILHIRAVLSDLIPKKQRILNRILLLTVPVPSNRRGIWSWNSTWQIARWH